jgi:hypothetical protein
MPKPLEGVNTPDHERVPRVSDGRMLFVTWGTADGGPADIRVASRSSTLATFSATAPVAGINTAAVDASIWFSADNKLVYFFSNRPDGVGLHDIYVGDVGPAGIADVRLLPGVNSAYEESSPVVTADGLTMYFSSSRPAPAAQGGSDIWVARRAQTGVAFEAPEILPELNSPMADNVTWVSRDSCRLIVTSSRDAGMDGQFVYDFYEAVRR